MAKRQAEAEAYGRGQRPACPSNGVSLLVIGMDGGRYQSREKEAETGSRWLEEKVLFGLSTASRPPDRWDLYSYAGLVDRREDKGRAKADDLYVQTVAWILESSPQFFPSPADLYEAGGRRHGPDVHGRGGEPDHDGPGAESTEGPAWPAQARCTVPVERECPKTTGGGDPGAARCPVGDRGAVGTGSRERSGERCLT